MHLDEQFSQVRTNILIIDELPKHSQVYRLHMQKKRHKEVNAITQKSNESMAFYVDKQKCNHQSYTKNLTRGKRNNYFCDHCKISSQSLKRCFKIHGYPISSKSSQNRRITAHVTVKHVDNLENKMDVDNSGFTSVQYNTLLILLGKKETPKILPHPMNHF